LPDLDGWTGSGFAYSEAVDVLAIDEVVGVGWPAVLPVADVMNMQPPVAVTPRYPTAPVTLFDHHPGAI